jgi:DNA-binding NarL/FixJ family response regulator
MAGNRLPFVKRYRVITLKLLIVDDHAGMRTLIRELVRGMATEICECASGEHAVELSASYAPDVITMDLRLGTMSGLTAAKEILHRQPAVSILVVTQFDHPRLRSLASETGIKAFICKDDLPALQAHLRALAAPAV